jgi:hypothetical protein
LDLVHTSSALDEKGSYYQVWIALVDAVVDPIVGSQVTDVDFDKQIHFCYFYNSETVL